MGELPREELVVAAARQPGLADRTARRRRQVGVHGVGAIVCEEREGEERAEEHEHQRDQRELAQRGDRLRERRYGMSCCLVEEGQEEDPEHAAGTEGHPARGECDGERDERVWVMAELLRTGKAAPDDLRMSFEPLD